MLNSAKIGKGPFVCVFAGFAGFFAQLRAGASLPEQALSASFWRCLSPGKRSLSKNKLFKSDRATFCSL